MVRETLAHAARDWMAARAEDLLPAEYFHVIFTLPAEIARIALWNKRAVYGLLFKASAETVMTISADPKRMGATVGITSVLHTWGSAMTHHPHIHMVVPPLGRLLRHRLPGNGMAAYRRTVQDGSPASRASFCMCACCRDCSDGCFWKG